jgi:hypothetical protein
MAVAGPGVVMAACDRRYARRGRGAFPEYWPIRGLRAWPPSIRSARKLAAELAPRVGFEPTTLR